MKTYDSNKVTLVCGGFVIGGFAEDSKVTVNRRNDTFSLKVGTDGEGTRSKSNDKSGEIKVSLMQTSESNAILSAFAQADELTNNGTFPFMMKDNSGDSYWAAATAWVVKPPEASNNREAGTREWTIQTDDLEWFEGGN